MANMAASNPGKENIGHRPFPSEMILESRSQCESLADLHEAVEVVSLIVTGVALHL
jgi:hypothetical protein